MSVIRKLPNGRFRIEFKAKVEDGSWKKYNKTFDLRRECVEFENKIRLEEEKNALETKKDTLNDVFVDFVSSKSVKDSTIRNYDKVYRNHILNHFKKSETMDKIINYSNISNWRRYVVSLNCTTEYKNKIISVMCDLINTSILKSCVDDKEAKSCLLALNRISNLNEKQSERRFITKEDFDKYINTYNKDSWWYIYFNVMYYCGLRISEASGLTWNNIANQTLTIDKQYVSTYGFSTPKSKLSYRTIPLLPWLYDLLLDYKKSIHARETDRVFRISQQRIREVHSNHCIEAGLTPIKVHALRHSYCSMLFQAYKSKGLPVDFKTVASCMGHSVEETMNVYSHLYPNDISNLTTIMNDFVEQKKEEL